MKDEIVVLHISDMQFGRNHRFGRLAGEQDPSEINFETLFERLSLDIDLLSKDSPPIDLIIITGDLAETGAKSEFNDALEFLIKLSDKLKIPRDRVIIIPGNHDINRKLCAGYFNTCDGNEEKPVAPFYPKWQHYCSVFSKFYDQTKLTFNEDTPWTLYEIPDLNVVIAGLNSTLPETHLDDSHYGQVGEPQLRWFKNHLEKYKQAGWLRLVAVHHNVERGAILDDENLRDRDMLDDILGPYSNIILHGHTHQTRLGWLRQNVPIISTGSTALKAESLPTETGNQYQLLTIKRSSLQRKLRWYDRNGNKWTGDTRHSQDGSSWVIKDDVNFDSTHGCLNPEAPTPESPQDPKADDSAIQINKPINTEAVKRRLDLIPRVRLIAETSHRAIRRDEQDRMLDLLKSDRIVSVSADWAHGKDGFIASVLHKEGGDSALESVYRIHCGTATTCDDLFSSSEIQLGMSFQEFTAAAVALKHPVLLLDDLSQQLSIGKERDLLEFKLKAVLEFCPALNIILIGRHPPKLENAEKSVLIKALDGSELIQYLKFHTYTHLKECDPSTIDRILAWSGGLPMHVDRLLKRMDYLTLSQILSEEGFLIDTHSEPVPESLIKSFSILRDTAEPRLRQSYKLLLILTVLRDGETFQSIRRFYKKEPFYQTNIDDLVEHALLEAVPLSMAAQELRLSSASSLTIQESPRLLRIPRQVRDYVNNQITDSDRDAIIAASVPLLFGDKWWEKIRLRNTIQNAYSQSTILGPGNEQVVIYQLLNNAIHRGNRRQIERYCQMCITYTSKLLERDRFRDAVIAAGSMLNLIKDANRTTSHAELLYMHGRALRMIGQRADAIHSLSQAIDIGGPGLINEFKAEIYLNLAYAYHSEERFADAKEAVCNVQKLAKPESSLSMQADAIEAELSLDGPELKAKLVSIEEKARAKGHSSAADNIALDLAIDCSDTTEALEWLSRVLRPGNDGYNRARAIVEKAAVLAKEKRIIEMSSNDYSVLGAAYGYCYSQRIGALLNKCHRSLWTLCARSGQMPILVRLYRYSSFFWRLRGEETREKEYITELDDMKYREKLGNELLHLNIELTYIERRRRIFFN